MEFPTALVFTSASIASSFAVINGLKQEIVGILEGADLNIQTSKKVSISHLDSQLVTAIISYGLHAFNLILDRFVSNSRRSLAWN